MAMDAVTTVRNIRSEADAAPSRKLTLAVLTDGEDRERFQAGERYIKDLANVTDIAYISDNSEAPEDSMSKVMPGAQIFIPMNELVDFEEELARLNKEKARLESEVQRAEKKLSNEKFVSKAPENVVQAERDKKVRYEEMLQATVEQIAQLSGKAEN